MIIDNIELNYEEDLRIDESQLDAECIHQPILVARYAEISAQAGFLFDQADQEVKVVRAELRGIADENGAKNDSARESFYRTHPKHIAAKNEWMEARKNAEFCRNACFAVQQRKVMLVNLVTLHGQNYFAAPSIPRTLGDIREGVESRADKSHTEIMKVLAKRAKRRSTKNEENIAPEKKKKISPRKRRKLGRKK